MKLQAQKFAPYQYDHFLNYTAQIVTYHLNQI